MIITPSTVNLLLDKKQVYGFSLGWNKPFPYPELQEDWELIDEDEFYSLYNLREHIFRSSNIKKILRSDILRQHHLLSFTARKSFSDPSQNSIAWKVSLNGIPVGEGMITKEWEVFELELPTHYKKNIAGDIVTISLTNHSNSLLKKDSNSLWEVKDIHFMANRK